MDPCIQALINIDTITDKILSYLTVVDLLKVSTVCKTWQNVVERILIKRSRFSSVESRDITCVWNCSSHQESFANPDNNNTKRIKLSSECNSPLDEIKESVLKWKSCWQQPPKILILLCKMIEDNQKSKKIIKEIHELFIKHFPENCKLIIVRGYTYSTRYSKPASFLKMESLLLFPSHSNKINMFTSTFSKSKKSNKQFLTAMQSFLNEQNNLKFLLFFFDISKSFVVDRISDTFISFLRKDMQLDDSVVILGCAVKGFSSIFYSNGSKKCNDKMQSNELFYDEIDGDLQFIAMAVSGSSVASASVMADSEVNTVSHLTRKLQFLYESISFTSLTNCFGIIVSCIDRIDYNNWYCSQYLEYFKDVDEHVEIQLFKQKFPGMPVLIMHGFGEIGGNFNLKSANLSKSDSLCNFHASIFAVVQFND